MIDYFTMPELFVASHGAKLSTNQIRGCGKNNNLCRIIWKYYKIYVKIRISKL